MGRRRDRRTDRTRSLPEPRWAPGDPTVALPAPGRAPGRAPAHGRTAAAVRASTPAHARSVAPRGSRVGLGVRSALLGVAAGSRASLALAGPALADPARGRVTRGLTRFGVLVELTNDKLPTTPSRLVPPGPQSRAVAAALGGAALARQRGRSVLLPAATAALFSTVGTFGGAAWRTWAAQRGPDWRGALAEDVVAVTLATLASRTR
ncbi:hypothetical protein [Cellulomonas endometrii]|uniref:hypothetical protein n=1 Tax=Cellulomonas endometrii TaxID=3036301 RepID=UPI0024ADEADD|nr:hypothetical protein [Cellulomonas endometrii]